jgi:hypothetical protein
MATGTEEDIHRAVHEAGGPDTPSIDFLFMGDQRATVREDVERIRGWPYLTRLEVGGFLYDVGTGHVTRLC